MGWVFVVLGIVVGIAALAAAAYLFHVFPRRRRDSLAYFASVKYAHRGLHDASKPENSLAAFAAAREAGYGAELDIHLTADGKLAVMHDNNVKRMCGVDLKISEHSFADLASLRLSGTEEHVPAFEEVLDIAKTMPLLIEFKADGDNANKLCETAFTLLDHYEGPFCVESFDPRCVKWMRRNRPQTVRGQLAANFEAGDVGKGRVVAFMLTNLLCNVSARPDFIAYDLNAKNKFPVKVAKKLGAGIFWWTVRTPEKANELLAQNDTIIFERFMA